MEWEQGERLDREEKGGKHMYILGAKMWTSLMGEHIIHSAYHNHLFQHLHGISQFCSAADRAR